MNTPPVLKIIEPTVGFNTGVVELDRFVNSY